MRAHHQNPAGRPPDALLQPPGNPVPADQFPLIEEHVETGLVQVARQHPDPCGIFVPVGHENIPAPHRHDQSLNPPRFRSMPSGM
jgi:hypothetical protein